MFPFHKPLTDTEREKLSEYDDLMAALLARRGILINEDAERFLNPSYKDHLHDPFLMTDMSIAAKRLATAILSGERIAVWSDYDCDGIPGAVLMYDFLKKTGANFENYIPHRHNEGYGMNVYGIEKLAKNGVKLVVTIDSGITDVVPVAKANELGIETIITDHHLPNGALPSAFAVLNPNARADETYPFKGLCGAGVAWKLVCATLEVESSFRKKIPEGWEKWLLDMVGLATIADMVPLVDENRVLAKYGLVVMQKSPRIGLQKLCRIARVEQRTITEDDVGFMIAPRINAASRMGDAFDAFKLFITADENEADMLARKLEKANRSRKAEAGAITRAVHLRIKERGGLQSVIAIGDPTWRPSLLGLVASNIADEFERPVFLWGREGNNSLKGSVRSWGTTHILELMNATENTFEEFGGHAVAGGFTVRDTEIFFLEERLVKAYERLIKNKKNENDFSQHTDALITPEEINKILLTRIEKLAPFGQMNPKPVFLLRNILIRKISRFGKSNEHLEIKISVDKNTNINAIAFFAKGHIARAANMLTNTSRVNMLAHIERDSFSRTNQIRLRLLDIRIV